MQVNAPEQIECTVQYVVVASCRQWDRLAIKKLEQSARPSFTFYLYFSRQRKPRFDILDCAQQIRNGCPVKDNYLQLSTVNAPLHGSAMWSRASVGRRDKFVW
jgi:hypothetical protein